MLDQYGRSVEHRLLWQAADSLPSVGELMARWLEGTITYQPGYHGPVPDAETEGLRAVLAAANRAGYVTDFSQPGVPLHHGSGQRASVCGYCSEETMAYLSSVSLSSDLIAITFPPGTRSSGQVVVTVRDGEECTWVGLPADAVDIDGHYREALSDSGLMALHTAWQVHLIDPVWGRNDLLWDALRAFGAVAKPGGGPA
jgi:hypothetical protein